VNLCIGQRSEEAVKNSVCDCEQSADQTKFPTLENNRIFPTDNFQICQSSHNHRTTTTTKMYFIDHKPIFQSTEANKKNQQVHLLSSFANSHNF